MKLYKLTNEFGKTRNQTQWGENVTHSGIGVGKLCSPGYIHAYEDPLIAVIMNPLHAAFKNPRMWKAEGEIALRDGQLKCGCIQLTTIKEITLPVVTMEQKIKFAILCALEVETNQQWVDWANRWLDGSDRSEKSAKAAQGIWTTMSARYVTEAAAIYANWHAVIYEAAYEAAYETYRAKVAAKVAEYTYYEKDIDLISIAKKAILY